MKLSKKDLSQIKLWIKALRSGKYKQTKRQLQISDSYCCMGLACHIVIPKEKQYLCSGILIGTYPHHQKNAPYWLRGIDDMFGVLGKAFSELNDCEDFTFDEIADILELIYIHSALY